MTVVKIQGKLPAAVGEVLEPLASAIYHQQGGHWVAVVELAHVDRNDPSDEDIKRTVTLRLTHLEVARDAQEDTLRKVMQALYLHRTASGTLDKDCTVEEADWVLKLAGESLHAQEAVRLRIALRYWADRAVEAAAALSLAGKREDILKELDTLAKGLSNALAVIPDADDGAAADPIEFLRTGSGVHVGGAR